MAKKSKVNVCAVLETAIILIGIIYIIVCTIMGLHNKWAFRLGFAALVVIYMIVADFVEPVVMKRFKKKHPMQVRAYYIYAALDVVGMLGLLWFVVMAGMFEDITHYAGIAIFAVCFVPKRTFYNKFNQRKVYYEEPDEDEDDFDIDLFD